MKFNSFFPGLKHYSLKELLKRLFWSLVGSKLFIIIPRHLYELRNILLRLFGAEIGQNTKIFPTVKITHPWLLKVGENTVISWNVTIYNLALLEIGNDTIISQNVHFCGGSHDYKSKGFELIRSKIKICDNVWIAADAFIGPSVTVQSNCIIAARSVCVKNIEPNSIVGGNPACLIKKFEKPRILVGSVS